MSKAKPRKKTASAWIRKHYRRTVADLVDGADAEDCGDALRIAAIKHSIRKWEGVLPTNLKAHGLKVVDRAIFSSEGKKILPLDASTCALCELYKMDCDSCPVTLSGALECADRDSAYHKAGYTPNARNVGAMVKVLEKALEWEKGNLTVDREMMEAVASMLKSVADLSR
jgi:hypothetical protein